MRAIPFWFEYFNFHLFLTITSRIELQPQLSVSICVCGAYTLYVKQGVSPGGVDSSNGLFAPEARTNLRVEVQFATFAPRQTTDKPMSCYIHYKFVGHFSCERRIAARTT